MRHATVAVVLCVASLAAIARADLPPPGQAEVVIEVVLENQAAFPDLAFVALDCWPALPPGIGTARSGESIRCLPRDVISIYGVPRAEVESIGTNPTGARSSVVAKGKPCGALAAADTRYPKGTPYESARVTYRIEAAPDGACKLQRVSVVGETADQRRARVDAAGSLGSPEPAEAPKRAACGACAIARDDAPPSLVLFALAVLGLARRRS